MEMHKTLYKIFLLGPKKKELLDITTNLQGTHKTVKHGNLQVAKSNSETLYKINYKLLQ